MRFQRFLIESNSDISKIDSFVSIDKKIEYTKSNFKMLGEGSSRIVFDLLDGTVLKLAKNVIGIKQNISESNIKNYLTIPIIKKDENNFWIIVEKAEEMDEEDFEKLTEMSFETFEENIHTISKFIKKKIDILPEETLKQIEKNTILKNVKNLMETFNLASGDISKLSSWGILNNSPKLIDVGLTREIYKNYYKDLK